jgi:A/G-specific adenine glycosylase
MDSIAQAVTTSCHNDEGVCAGLIGAAIEVWASTHLRSFPWRSWSDEYRLTVTEILLQQTAAAKVAGFVEGWLVDYPDWQALGSAPVIELETRLRPLGLHRRRADVLHRLALSFAHEPQLALQDRPGVGQYVSRAVAVGTAGKAEAMVDVNFVRIIRRAFAGTWKSDYRYDDRLQRLAQRVVDGANDPRVVNWGTLDLAALVCKASVPACAACPIMTFCSVGSAAGAAS